MPSEQGRSAARRDFWISAALVAGGLTISGFSLLQLAETERPTMIEPATSIQMAQARAAQAESRKDHKSPSAQPSSRPADAKPGGTRPTTPPPQPARPDADAQKKSGTQPALPPAPAEKTAPPINAK
jgi:hypothetical protein